MRSPSEALPARATALFRWSKNSLAVGETCARLSSARAKFGSSEIALSKCAMESVMRSFSARSRPARNSFRASSDEVVIAILPAFAVAFDDEEEAGLLGSTCWQPTNVTTPNSRNKCVKDLSFPIGRRLPGRVACELDEFPFRMIVVLL